MKTVGYFEGTDPLILTELVANGFGTLPLGNDWDGYGKNASHLEPGTVDLIIGPLHKIVPPVRPPIEKEIPALKMGIGRYRGLDPVELLYPAKAYDIPVLIIAPKKYHKKSEEALGEAKSFVTLVAPENLNAKVREILEF
jgi:hypothetical protein